MGEIWVRIDVYYEKGRNYELRTAHLIGMKIIRIVSFLVLLGIVMAPALASAQVTPPTISPSVPGPLTGFTISKIYSIIVTVLQIIYTVFFIVAAIFIVLAAFDYLQSGGEADAVKEARNKIIYAAVAIGVALLSVAITGVVKSAIQ